MSMSDTEKSMDASSEEAESRSKNSRLTSRSIWSGLLVLAATIAVFWVVVLCRQVFPVASFDVPLEEGLKLSFSRNSSLLAVWVDYQYGPTLFFDVATGKERSRWDGRRPFGELELCEEQGTWLVRTRENIEDEYQVRRVNPWDGTETIVFRRPWSDLTLGQAELTELSADGRRWFHAKPETGVEIWDITSGEHWYTFEMKDVVDLAFSPDGKSVGAFNKEGEFRIWDLESREERAHFSGLACFRYATVKLDDFGVALLDVVHEDDSGDYVSRALLGPESGRVVQITDHRCLQRFSNGDVLLSHEPLRHDLCPEFPERHHNPPLSVGTLQREDQSGTVRWHRQFKVREIQPIHQTQFHLLAWTGKDQVTAIDLSTGREAWSQYFPADSSGFARHSFALSPDGRFVAYGYANGPDKVAFVRIWRL